MLPFDTRKFCLTAVVLPDGSANAARAAGRFIRSWGMEKRGSSFH